VIGAPFTVGLAKTKRDFRVAIALQTAKTPPFHSERSQFWLRRTLLKFEERAAEFPPNLGKTSEGLIDHQI
jgi:hypothetical protein